MAKKKSYAVIGLGRYGKAVARELLQNGVEVLAIDADPEVVSTVAKVIPHCKCADITKPGTIKELGIADMDAVVIAMASRLEDTVMATMMCKEAGVKLYIPELKLCGDNGAMIGCQGYYEYLAGHTAGQDLNAYATRDISLG